MAKRFVKETANYAKEKKENIQSKPWAEPVGIALGVTSSILNGLGSFVPGLSILGGACKMGSVLLNPSPTMHDLKRQTNDLEKKLENSSGLTKDALEKKMEELQEKTFLEIRGEIQTLAKEISKEMQSFKNELHDVKLVLEKTFQIISDIRYKDTIEKVDAAFDTYLDGSNNMSQTFNHLEGFLFEMQSLARQSLNPGKILTYLQTIKEHQSTVASQKAI